MLLKSISLKSFRNLQDIQIDFKQNITVLIGNNAQGKTNFLESIYFLATGNPIKAETDEEVIKFGGDVVNVEGVIERGNEEIKISTIIQKTENGFRKRFLVNGIARRMVDYAGNLVAVYFRPEDIDLVTGSPSLRREYIDSTISQIDREYRKVLNSYLKIITQKNKLLKLIREGMAKLDELDYWDNQQLGLGILLQEKRESFFQTINSYEKKFGDFEYQYLPNKISKERLQEITPREIQAAVSLIGPHRDDFLFLLKDKQSLRAEALKQGLRSDDLKDLAKYGSRGEQRTAVLDLKITELSFFEDVLKERPILLLDDIFSELDESHRSHVLELSKLQQTIIATVEYDDYLKSALKNEQIIKVENGVVTAASRIEDLR